MKLITPSLLKFALATTLLTIIFRYSLSYGIDNKTTIIIVLSAILYFIGMFIFGWYFGKKDVNYLPIYDVGFRFHFTTYFVFILVSELWFILKFNSEYEKIRIIHLTAIIWGVLLFFHFLLLLGTRKKAINGLEKEDLFE